jgi:hypothetical protein
MKAVTIAIIFFLTSVISFGQESSKRIILSRDEEMKVSVNDKDFLKARQGAEIYLKSLLSDTVYESHIRLNWAQSNKAAFDVHFGDNFDSKILERHTYYNIHYYLLDKADTLSYFDLLVDSTGNPTRFDKDCVFSSPLELLLSFRSLFPNKFKISFRKAVNIGREHGFDTRPFLNWVSLNKPGVYWSFSKKYPDGKRKRMDIHAKTGAIKEFYMPVFEK